MKVNLTQEQFVIFVQYVWNTHLPEWNANIWASIAAMEANRSFSEGWNYCESKLSMCTENDLSWTYKTTSGTILHVQQSRWNNEGPAFEVEIPDDRAAEGRTHYDYLQAALKEVPYLSWGEYFYGTDAISLKVHTYWSGGDVQKVLDARTKELKRQLGIREEKYEEFDEDYNEDGDYEGEDC